MNPKNPLVTKTIKNIELLRNDDTLKSIYIYGGEKFISHIIKECKLERHKTQDVTGDFKKYSSIPPIGIGVRWYMGKLGYVMVRKRTAKRKNITVTVDLPLSNNRNNNG